MQHGKVIVPEITRRIDELIAVLAAPEADGKNLDDTRRAIRELDRIGASAAPQLIRAITTGKRTEAAYAALALDQIGEPAVDAVREAWEMLTEADRWKIMRFRGLHDYDASLEFALRSLDSKDQQIRSQAIHYLGQHKELKARPKLLQMLNGDIPQLRWNVVDALTHLGGNETVDAFITLLDADNWAAKGEGLMVPRGEAPPWWPDGRPTIIKALVALKALDAAPAFLRVLQERGEGRGYLASFIIPALVQFNYRECIPELRRIAAADPSHLVPSLDKPTAIKRLAAHAIDQLES